MSKPITTGQRDREVSVIAFLRQAVPSYRDKSNHLNLGLGIGDDAAVLRPHLRSEWAVSCDFSLEGTHFLSNYPPESIGYKSLARATSDLAAMGAQPRYFLLALALPASKTEKWLGRFASGMSKAAAELGMRLIGGDTSRADLVTICITVVGEAPVRRVIPRSGAKAGDLLYVTGTLGAAQLGLEIVLRGLAHRPQFRMPTRAHFYPQIPVKLSRLLARKRIPSAMMDISDGLSTDLARLCAASGVGARVSADRLPAVKVPRSLLARGIDPLSLALNGGDDYGLLFTVPPNRLHALKSLGRSAQTTQIGEITPGTILKLIRADGTQSALRSKGWQPF